MGYTHYWAIDVNEADTGGAFMDLASDARAIIAAAAARGVPVVFEYDRPDEPAQIGDGVIRLNGVEDDGHETFRLDFTVAREPSVARPEGRSPRELADDAERQAWWEWYEYDSVVAHAGWRWAFCKTARKPYDAVVGAILIAAKDAFGARIEISSDGHFNDGQASRDSHGTWADARALYEAALGRPAKDPLGRAAA